MTKKIFKIYGVAAIVGLFLLSSIVPTGLAAINQNQQQQQQQQQQGGSGGVIDPTYFKKWSSDEFDKSEGCISTVLNDYLYVLVQVLDMDGMIRKNATIAILKYRMDNGRLITSVILDDLGIPCDIVAFKGYIYAIVEFGEPVDEMAPALLKFDTNLDLKIIQDIDIPGVNLQPRDIDVDNDYIYVAGNTIIGYDAFDDIFLAKFDEYCNPEWDEYVFYEKQEAQGIIFDGMAVYDNHIYLTGGCAHPDATIDQSLLLKYDTNGKLIEEVIGEYDGFGTSIEGYDGKIYVSYSKQKDGIDFYDLSISAYDTDLNPIWEKTFNQGINWIEWGFDIVILGDYLYLCGVILGAFSPTIDGFVLKCNIDTHQEKWLKKIEEESWVFSIHADTDYLYLSGATGNQEYKSGKAFILKCDHNGNYGPNDRPSAPSINGKTRGKVGEEYEYTFVSTDPEGEDVYYHIYWGDGEFDEWVGPYSSGQGVTVNHTWSEKGTYTIEAKAQDISGVESDWGSLAVTMPYNNNQDSQSSQGFIEGYTTTTTDSPTTTITTTTSQTVTSTLTSTTTEIGKSSTNR